MKLLINNFNLADIFINSKYNINKNKNFVNTNDNTYIRKNILSSETVIHNITDKWLKNSCLNCKYTTFNIILFFI